MSPRSGLVAEQEEDAAEVVQRLAGVDEVADTPEDLHGVLHVEACDDQLACSFRDLRSLEI